MGEHETSQQAPRRGSVVMLQGLLIACWAAVSVLLAVVVCGAIMMADALPFDGPDRPRVGEHVYTIIVWVGIGVGLLGGGVLGVIFARESRSGRDRGVV